MIGRRSVLALVAAAGLLSSCTKEKGNSPVVQLEGEITEENPVGVKADAELEVILYSGWFGAKFATATHIPAYQKLFPKANVKFAVKPDIAGLRARFTEESAPDVVNNAGPKPLDLPGLIDRGLVADLSDLLKTKGVGSTSKLADTLLPVAIEQGTFNGKLYALNYAYVAYGLWYSGKLFRDNGWAAPSTWAEFTDLLDRMKAAGLVPYAYAGVDGAANQYQAMLTTAAKLGGPEVLSRLDGLADGAWLDDAIKQAATMWGEIGRRYLDRGHLDLNRAQVQALHSQGRVGLYPSGSWLEAEQAKLTPPGFDYKVAAVAPPVVLAMPGETFFIAAMSKNVRGGKEYLRQMLSQEGARAFTEATRVQTVVKGAPEGADIVRDLLKDAQTVSYRWADLYPGLADECHRATNELMFQGGTATTFCEHMQRAADRVKRTR